MRGSPLVEFAVHFRNVLFGVLLQIVTEKSEKTKILFSKYRLHLVHFHSIQTFLQ